VAIDFPPFGYLINAPTVDYELTSGPPKEV